MAHAERGDLLCGNAYQRSSNHGQSGVSTIGRTDRTRSGLSGNPGLRAVSRSDPRLGAGFHIGLVAERFRSVRQLRHRNAVYGATRSVGRISLRAGSGLLQSPAPRELAFETAKLDRASETPRMDLAGRIDDRSGCAGTLRSGGTAAGVLSYAG